MANKCSPSEVHKELMKRKSYRESTPRTREDKLKKALSYRKRKNRC